MSEGLEATLSVALVVLVVVLVLVVVNRHRRAEGKSPIEEVWVVLWVVIGLAVGAPYGIAANLLAGLAGGLGAYFWQVLSDEAERKKDGSGQDELEQAIEELKDELDVAAFDHGVPGPGETRAETLIRLEEVEAIIDRVLGQKLGQK